MATNDSSVSFEETDTRYDEMHSTIEAWINDLVECVDDAQGSNQADHAVTLMHEYAHVLLHFEVDDEV